MAIPPTSSYDGTPPNLYINMEAAGQKLKRSRERLGLKYREVEEASARIAAAHGSDEYIITLSRLSEIENKGLVPSIYRIHSLCAIYQLSFAEVVGWYGIDMTRIPPDSRTIRHARTHEVALDDTDEGEVQVPLELDPGFRSASTTYLSRFIQQWGKIPLMLLRHIDLRGHRYGMIGEDDWSMHPIIPPGSLVVIDESRRKVCNTGWTSEFERPIYFFELKDGFACSWCIQVGGQIILQPHPSSLTPSRVYDFPRDIEVIGQVTNVAKSVDPILHKRPSSLL